MKKSICLFVILIISLSLYGFVDAKASSSGTSKNSFFISVLINGKKISGTHPVTLVNNQYLISSTPILKALGGKVNWNSSTKRISVKLKGKQFALYANKKVVYVGNKRISLETAPRVINGKTMMSANLLEKISGTKVIFDKKTRQVRITASKSGTDSSKSKKLSTLSGKIVVIDPGHGGNTNGAKYGGLKEKDLNLDVSLRLYSLLKSKGIKVYLTRKTDSTLTLAQRYNYANSVKATLFVSVHHNALPNNASYKGTETLYSPSGTTLKGISSKNLAKVVQTELVKRLGTINRGIISRPELAVLRHSKMPSIIAEIGYMTNSKERQRINSSSFKQKSAEALCSAIVKTLNQMK